MTALNPGWPDSPSGGSLGDRRNATAIDRPKSVADLCGCIKTRVSQSLAIYPQGGGTSLSYGGIPRAPGVGIDTRSLNRVIDYPAADMTITIEAGITLATLQGVLREQHQRLLIEAPQADRATIGGIYATNTSGPRRFGAGSPRDHILGVSFVNGEGKVIQGGGRVVKNVAGYDFPKLLTGSLGTLGVITQLTLKVRPLPEASAIVWVPLPSLESLTTSLDRLNTSATRPVAIEVLNRSAAAIVAEPLKLPVDEWNIAIGFEDNATSVQWQTDRLLLELSRPNMVIEKGEEADPLWSALAEFAAAEIGPVSIQANLRPSMLAGFLKLLDTGSWAIQSRAGNGLVTAHWMGDTTLEILTPILETLRSEAVQAGGNLMLPRCPTDWKPSLKVWGEPRADWLVAERLKNALDPRGVLNPGRFVGAI